MSIHIDGKAARFIAAYRSMLTAAASVIPPQIEGVHL